MGLPLVVIGRRDACNKGLKRFFTGVACVRGHVAERFTANGNCVECAIYKTPNKRKGPTGSNTGWPPRALVAEGLNFRPLPQEIAAAFLYMEWAGWFTVALRTVHEDPALLKRFAPLLTAEEQGRMHAALEAHAAVMERIRSDLETVTPSTAQDTVEG